MMVAEVGGEVDRPRGMKNGGKEGEWPRNMKTKRQGVVKEPAD